jgi:hypothetical protein
MGAALSTIFFTSILGQGRPETWAFFQFQVSQSRWGHSVGRQAAMSLAEMQRQAHPHVYQYTMLFTHMILLWWPLRSCAGSHDGGSCGCPGSIADPATSSVLAAGCSHIRVAGPTKLLYTLDGHFVWRAVTDFEAGLADCSATQLLGCVSLVDEER